MEILWNDDGSSFWKLIINVAVVFLVSLKLTVIHWLHKSGRSTQKSFNASVFRSRHYLTRQWTKRISKILVLDDLRLLDLGGFFFLILAVWCGLSLLRLDLRCCFVMSLTFRLGRNNIGLDNVLENEDHADHRLIAKRAWRTSKIKSKLYWTL